MKVSKSASRAMLRQVPRQPLRLGRIRLAPTYLRALAVQHHDVPRPQFVAVIRFTRIACRGAEISRISRPTALVILVIPRRRTRALLEPSPRWPVALGKLLIRSV